MSHRNKRHLKQQETTLVINRGSITRSGPETNDPPTRPESGSETDSALPSESGVDRTDEIQGVSDDDVRTLAYAKWQEAGCPEGDGVAFWLDAERMLR